MWGWDKNFLWSKSVGGRAGEQISVRERSSSPRKAVHFSEIDQVKLMSQESLVSTAPSDGSRYGFLYF